ncbi:MAG TPA: NADH-quinone oxidoreductase subunit C, partial [Streptosporangiaceae bacterium]|nr:NADH-quinone oxidoreductase subunit C [Streptosporangiaceae bacterium]
MSENGTGEPEGSANLPAQAGQERLSEPVSRHGMFGGSTSGDTSGYGRLLVRVPPEVSTPRPYGSYFDELTDELARVLEA